MNVSSQLARIDRDLVHIGSVAPEENNSEHMNEEGVGMQPVSEQVIRTLANQLLKENNL